MKVCKLLGKFVNIRRTPEYVDIIEIRIFPARKDNLKFIKYTREVVELYGMSNNLRKCFECFSNLLDTWLFLAECNLFIL